MVQFEITSSQLSNQFTMKDSSVVTVGSYNLDAKTQTVININGTVYEKNENGEQGAYIGNFNGYMRDGSMRYSLSEMTRQQSNLVWTAIDELEAEIFKEND